MNSTQQLWNLCGCGSNAIEKNRAGRCSPCSNNHHNCGSSITCNPQQVKQTMKDHIGYISKTVTPATKFVQVTWCALDGDRLIPLRTRRHSLAMIEHAYPIGHGITKCTRTFEVGHLVRLKPTVKVKCPKCNKQIQLSLLDLPGAFDGGAK